MSLTVAVWQTSSTPLDVEENLERLARVLAEAAQAGAQLVVTPEMFTTGYDIPAADTLALAEPADGPTAQRIADLTREHGVGVLYGYPERVQAAGVGDCAVHNSAQLILDGQRLLNHRKMHLFSGLDQERFAPGDTAPAVAPVHGVPVAALICYDVEFPESVRAAVQAGAQAVLVPTANMVGYEAVSRVLVPARAYENHVPVVYANYVGIEGAQHYAGLSVAAQPDGSVQTGSADQEELLIVELDVGEAGGEAGPVEEATAAANYHRDLRTDLFGGPAVEPGTAGPEDVGVLEQLQDALPGRVHTVGEDLQPLRADRSGHLSAGLPLALVRATSVAEVQSVCRIAHATGTPLVVRGAGTGLAGGAIAGPGEIVLDVRAMDAISEVSVPDRLAVVGPGILNGELNRALARHGLWWAPDPASKDISTVGGNIAMNAGGLLCAKYGVTREAVLGLKVVLADGRLLELGHRSVKGVTGLDLTALMIGSEGTLGVIVEATLKLTPLPQGTVWTVGAFFPEVYDAAQAAADVVGAGLVPAIMELLDEPTLAAVVAHTGQRLGESGQAGAYLLVQCDGVGAAEEARQVADLLRAAGGTATLTDDPVESERLVGLRRLTFPSLEAAGSLLIEDVAVPRSQVPQMYRRIREIEQRHGVSIPTGCHAGDGNLHPTFVFHGEPGEVPEVIWTAAGELFTAALELGGTLSGEHGIGILKKAWLGDELGDDQLELQRRIKDLFDPRGILNAGKVFG